ncbi:MAG: DUF1266 domain-containing protein [Caldimonas sp.]
MEDMKVFHAARRLESGERAWAYAVGAMYHVAHGFAADGVDPLCAGDFQKDMLARDWGIRDRQTLVAQLTELGAEGHRHSHAARLRYYAMQWRPAIASIREELRALVRDGDDDAAANLWRLDAVQAGERGIRSSTLLAFDAARGVMLARAGLMLDWLTEDEAWSYLVDIARDVQRSYTSWAAYGADFVLSRDVWRGGSTPDAFNTAVDMLLHDQASPWVALPWELPFSTRPLTPVEPDKPMWTLERR